MSNLIIIAGHLGADVTINNTNTNGVPVANLRVATNRKYTNKLNQLVEDTTWHNVTCWDKLATTVATYMRKGSHVLIEGRLQNREFLGQAKYENGQVVVDGNGQPIMVKRYTTEIVARRVEFLDKKPGTATYPQAAAGVAVQPVAAVAPAIIPAVAVVPPVAPVVAAAPEAVAATFVQAAPAGTVAVDNSVPPVVVAPPPGV